MKLIEEKGNLFDLEDTHYLVHCVSADFALGQGIAKEFVKRKQMRVYLEGYINMSTISPTEYDIIQRVYPCILINKVFNLVTKQRYWHKPTYESLTRALVSMRSIVSQGTIKKIAMPRIGCGLDRLNWSKVKSIIEDVFDNVDCEIIVRYLED
jgi:hypothetical protein